MYVHNLFKIMTKLYIHCIMLVYQLDTGGRTRKAMPVYGACYDIMSLTYLYIK